MHGCASKSEEKGTINSEPNVAIEQPKGQISQLFGLHRVVGCFFFLIGC